MHTFENVQLFRGPPVSIKLSEESISRFLGYACFCFCTTHSRISGESRRGVYIICNVFGSGVGPLRVCSCAAAVGRRRGTRFRIRPGIVLGAGATFSPAAVAPAPEIGGDALTRGTPMTLGVVWSSRAARTWRVVGGVQWILHWSYSTGRRAAKHCGH